MRRLGHRRWFVLGVAALILWAFPARGQDLPEYRLKAAILYNFALFTEWPAAAGATLNLCLVGRDPFGADIDALQGKPVGSRAMAVHRKGEAEPLQACDMVFVTPTAIGQLPRILEGVRGRAVLTVADTPGAARQGVALNLAVAQGRLTFEANLPAARAAGLELKAKLLRLATEVYQ